MMTFPNALSVLRLILIPFFLYAFFIQHTELFFILFFLAGLSDCLDGFLARKLKITSQLGHFLDTLADVPFYGAALLILLISYPKEYINHIFWIFIFVFTSLIPLFLSLTTYKKIFFEHTKLYKLMSSLLFMVVLTSLFMNVSVMIPMIMIGFIIANIHLSYIIFNKRS